MQPDLAKFLERNTISGYRAYALSAVGVCAATALRVALNPVLGDAAPYVFQALMLLFASGFGGYGPGFFCLVTLLVLGWFYIPPYDLPLAQKIASEIATTIAGGMIWLVTATMRAALLKAAKAQREADYLGREMHHRVKNLFAVVASMTTLSARERPDAASALAELRARIQSLSQAHDVAVHQITSATLTDLMDRLMAPYKMPGAGESRVIVSGEEVVLPHSCVTPLALIFHEMATNAVKYGALATRDGYVRLSWQVQDDTLEITWQEFGAGEPSERGVPGFGTVMVDASVAQMRGRMDRELNGDGIVTRLIVPLQHAGGKQFPSEKAGASQGPWETSLSSSSAHPGSRRFFRRKPGIRDSRS